MLSAFAGACRDLVGGGDPRVARTEIFAGDSRAVRVTGVHGGVDVEGSLAPSCGPYDWYTSLVPNNGSIDVDFTMYAREDGCTVAGPPPFGYRAEIRGVRPGRGRIRIRHGVSDTSDFTAAYVFDDTVTVR